jgi:hypothetical protein
MLTDLGLQTEEQIKSYNDSRSRRANSMLDGTFPGGCVSTALCTNCNHLFSDSICCCVGLGVCLNCSFDNSLKVLYQGKEIYMKDVPVSKSSINFGFYSKNDITKIVDKFSADSKYDHDGFSLAKDLKEEINKL